MTYGLRIVDHGPVWVHSEVWESMQKYILDWDKHGITLMRMGIREGLFGFLAFLEEDSYFILMSSNDCVKWIDCVDFIQIF